MKVIILGTGTSQGVPVIGCKCETCLSDNPKDNRLRTSAYIKINDSKLLIDTSVDFRMQMLGNKISDLDAVLYTHHHVDHIFGLDDLRQITQKHDKTIDIYGNKNTLDEMRITFRGNIKIFGYRINDFAYITDASAIDEKEMNKLKGLKVLVLNALRIRPHPTHFNLQEAIEISKLLKPEKTYFTHLTHDILHDKINKTLPKGIELAYDGLELEM